MPPQAGSAHQVVQLHMTNWSPDGSCSHLATITSVINEMSAIQRRSGNHPIIVHCRSNNDYIIIYNVCATTVKNLWKLLKVELSITEYIMLPSNYHQTSTGVSPSLYCWRLPLRVWWQWQHSNVCVCILSAATQKNEKRSS
jgi:hypothetical protein